jgi:DNA-binding winged helix-turn-helix (wHTH) protein
MRISCGDFIFDSETRELLRSGQPVTLSPKAFQLLEILVENRPNAVAKEQLHDRVWPNTFVVEANLSNLVGEVRRAFHDDPKNPRFIRTIHRFGYAFRGETRNLPRGEPTTTRAICRLIWEGGSSTLSEGEHIIGRDPDVAILLDSPSVSRRHALICVAEGQATIEDLGSKNGLFVGGRPAQGRVSLADGDVITAGIVELKFRMICPAIPTQTLL